MQPQRTGPSRPPSTEEMVTFLAKAFRLCTRDSRLVVLALDDIHHIDEFSGRVIQQLFTVEMNILFLGTVDSAFISELKIDPDFWDELDGRSRAE